MLKLGSLILWRRYAILVKPALFGKTVFVEFSANFQCKYRNKCTGNIPEGSFRHFFKNFWDMGSFIAYLCGLLQQFFQMPMKLFKIAKNIRAINKYHFLVEGNSKFCHSLPKKIHFCCEGNSSGRNGHSTLK